MSINKCILKNTKVTRLVFVLTLILLSFIQFSNNSYANENMEKPAINSKAAILMDLDSGNILYDKNMNEKVYPASTTKILTAILAIENLDLNSSTVVTKQAITLPYGSSNAALIEGEVISVKDLLYCLMLKSGNDSANVLAEAVSGNIEDFVVKMNEKAKEIGCTNTNFVNAHGYHDDNHYTSPSDMMKILAYALKNESFTKICSTTSYTVKATNKTDKERELVNTNRLITNSRESYLSQNYEYCVCGKTGYTDEAGRTFVAYGQKNNYNLILGVFDVMDVDGVDGRYVDAKALFEYGFNNFEKEILAAKSDYTFTYCDQEKNLLYTCKLKEDIVVLMPHFQDSISNVSLISYITNFDYKALSDIDINSQINKNQVMGKVKFTFSQNSIYFDKDYDMVLVKVEKAPLKIDFVNIVTTISFVIVYIVLGFTLIFIIFCILKKKKKRSSKKVKELKKAVQKTSYTNSASYRRRNKKL